MTACNVVHIGFPKTATTTLQSAMKKHPEVCYAGKSIRDGMKPSLSLEIAKAVFFMTDRQFRDGIQELQDRVYKDSEGFKCFFLSDEAFSFAEFMKIGLHYWERQVVTDHEVVARRLSLLFSGAQVMFSTRGQEDFIKSFYLQSVKVDHIHETFDAFMEREISSLDHRSMLNLLKYDDVFEAYSAEFGVDNVRVDVFENYRSDISSFLRGASETCRIDGDTLVSGWAGEHNNKSPEFQPGRLDKIARAAIPKVITAALPGDFKKKCRKLISRPVPAVSLSQEVRLRLEDVFHESNSRLTTSAGVSLPRDHYLLN